MGINYTAELLDNDDDWAKLYKTLGEGHPDVVHSIIRHLHILGVRSYVLEDLYIDRDYSADYIQFYARTFRTYPRHCKRAHFFSDDITSILTQRRSAKQLHQFREIALKNYCGFCVIRPLLNAPIGRTVLRAQVREFANMESSVTCRAEYNVNLLGVDLKVTGTAYLQQDARVGACAQVSIWAGMRHMHTRHKYNWLSVADITRLASPTTNAEATTLPAGSEFLTSESMLRAITEAGYQPLCFGKHNVAKNILPYVESGIPVILGINIGTKVGHAVTVIGRVFTKQVQPTSNVIDYVATFIVHDDQGGPYMLLPVDHSASTSHSFGRDTIIRTMPFRVELTMGHATFAVALMSPRVFSTAAIAEASARDRIYRALNDLPVIRQELSALELPVNERLLNDLQRSHADCKIVLRTYLSSAAGYRRYIADSTACDDLKDVLLTLHLPHFNWVTEIATIDSHNQSSIGLRRIYGHTIIDATSTGRGDDAFLALHLPGLLFTRSTDGLGQGQEHLKIIQDDVTYECRTKNS